MKFNEGDIVLLISKNESDIGKVVEIDMEYNEYSGKVENYYVIHFWYQEINTKNNYKPNTYLDEDWDDLLYDAYEYKDKAFKLIFS